MSNDIYYEKRLNREEHFRIVDTFCCGPDDPLNTFLCDDSFDYEENRLGATYLLFENIDNYILGFYTLKTNAIQIQEDDNLVNALPMIEISRIAIEYEFQRNGLGKQLFYEYILPKIEEVAKIVAIFGIMVFVEEDNDRAVAFYEHLGFVKANTQVQNQITDTFNEDCVLYITSLRESDE